MAEEKKNGATAEGTQDRKKTDRELLYQLEGRPSFITAFPLGLQHVLAMFTGNLAPILIIAGVCNLSPEHRIIMVQCAMFVSGLTTFVQLYPIKIGKFQIGAGLPIVMGTSFAFVPTAISIGSASGIGAVLGGTLLGSFTEVIMGFFFKPLKKFFPPLVVGCVLITIGSNLLVVGVNYFAGGVGSPDYASPQNLFLGFLVFFIIIAIQRFGRGMWKISAILIAIVVGYIVAIFMGKADLSAVATSGLIAFPIPFFLKPTFSVGAALSFAAIFVVSGLETIGNTSGITIAGFNREATGEETSGAILADALGSTTASIFNALPNTAFGQNAGIVAMTKVVNKWCIALGAFTLMIAGLFPKLGAIFAAIPSSVLGGAVITVFAMIFINGIKMIAKAGFSDRNVLVLGITLGLGLGLGSHPEAVAGLPTWLHFLFEDTVASVCIISILANIIFPMKDEDDIEKAKAALLDQD